MHTADIANEVKFKKIKQRQSHNGKFDLKTNVINFKHL